MDKRLKEISSRLGEYSLGKFDKRIRLSSSLDNVDAISSGINMLGDELKAITISRDYFTNIFNSVSDMIFIVNGRGIIDDVNSSAEKQLNYTSGSLKGKPFNNLHKGENSFFKNVINELKINDPLISIDTIFSTKDGKLIPVRLNASYFKKNDQKKRRVLLTATNITFQMRTENLVIRAIIDTQEKERQRFAKDLHDSLTQQLSAINMYISTTATLIKNQHQKKILMKSKKALTEVIGNMRNICFNLMPKILEEFGLVKAVEEFCGHYLNHKKVSFIIKQDSSLPQFSSELKIDLYRIIQEFITNAVRHGKASKVNISFGYNRQNLQIKLIDNGKGFDPAQSRKGMGLQNVQSRVKSHYGKIKITSILSHGTCYSITIPLNIYNDA